MVPGKRPPAPSVNYRPPTALLRKTKAQALISAGIRTWGEDDYCILEGEVMAGRIYPEIKGEPKWMWPTQHVRDLDQEALIGCSIAKALGAHGFGPSLLARLRHVHSSTGCDCYMVTEFSGSHARVDHMSVIMLRPAIPDQNCTKRHAPL
jgi:hypothetical protein